MRKLRLWLRRHLWFHLVVALIMAGCSALMFGCVAAGFSEPRFQQLIWALIPVENAVTIWLLKRETRSYQALITTILREPQADVPAPR